MSGTTSNSQCPACGSMEYQYYCDWKPFDYISGECLNCGFVMYPKFEQMTLEELNEQRVDQELEPLEELPKINLKEIF